MLNFIFFFSHLDKNKIIDFKNYLYSNSNDELLFLTRSNFDFFFDIKYIELKKILTGKYLLIQVKNNLIVSEIDILNEKLNFFLETIKKFNLNLFFFCAIGEDRYYFKDFISKSKIYNNKHLFELVIKKNQLHFSYLFLLELKIYYLYLFRINNSRSIYNMNNLQYSYYY